MDCRLERTKKKGKEPLRRLELLTGRKLRPSCRVPKATAGVETIEAPKETWRERGGGIVLSEDISGSNNRRNTHKAKSEKVNSEPEAVEMENGLAF